MVTAPAIVASPAAEAEKAPAEPAPPRGKVVEQALTCELDQWSASTR